MENQVVKEKTCESCRYLTEKGADGVGWCIEQSWITNFGYTCQCHEPDFNGWERITPDNVEYLHNIPPERLMIAVMHREKPEYMEYSEMFRNLDTMAELGGFYYYELPELKIE